MPLNDIQHEVLRAELVRLADNGLDWPDATAQCILAYFKLSVAYELNYDPNFCNVRNPTNVWALVQVSGEERPSGVRSVSHRVKYKMIAHFRAVPILKTCPFSKYPRLL